MVTRPTDITAAETDVNSPLSQTLMDKLRAWARTFLLDLMNISTGHDHDGSTQDHGAPIKRVNADVVKASGGLGVTSGQLQANVDGVTVDVDGSNNLYIPADAINRDRLDAANTEPFVQAGVGSVTATNYDITSTVNQYGFWPAGKANNSGGTLGDSCQIHIHDESWTGFDFGARGNNTYGVSVALQAHNASGTGGTVTVYAKFVYVDSSMYAPIFIFTRNRKTGWIRCGGYESDPEGMERAPVIAEQDEDICIIELHKNAELITHINKSSKKHGWASQIMHGLFWNVITLKDNCTPVLSIDDCPFLYGDNVKVIDFDFDLLAAQKSELEFKNDNPYWELWEQGWNDVMNKLEVEKEIN